MFRYTVSSESLISVASFLFSSICWQWVIDCVVQANVMLEYTLDDADDLLEKNLSAAVKTLAQVDEDLGFLRDQMTTLEVSIL